MATREHLTCYFSFRSPFAWVAVHRLRRAPELAACDIELIPTWPEVIFGGHMDNPSDNIFKLAYVGSHRLRRLT
eukprot:COSAG01_NODE_335_length_18690_cov_7.693185_16_plen_74_part_00